MKYSLAGVNGNAFSIMAYTSNALKREGMSELVDKMRAEATSGDYDNLVQVCEGYLDKVNEQK